MLRKRIDRIRELYGTVLAFPWHSPTLSEKVGLREEGRELAREEEGCTAII